MQDFHFNCIQNKDGDKVEMLLTDSNSLMYKMETQNVHERLYKNKDLLDFSNYWKDLKYCGNSNDLRCSYKSFVGFKAKINTYIAKGIHEYKITKSINKSVLDDELKHEDYINFLFNRSYIRYEINRI